MKKFALLSAGSLMLGPTGCTGGVYGPSPASTETTVPQVSGIYFLDAQSASIPLQGAQNVPVHTQFAIDFNTEMNVSAMPQIFFTDSNNQAVANTPAWEAVNVLKVTPAADLQFNMQYSLSLGDGAEDTKGNKLVLTNKATAAFKTTSG